MTALSARGAHDALRAGIGAPRAHRVVAFVAIASGDADYTRTSPAVRPHWAPTATDNGNGQQPEQPPAPALAALLTCGRCGDGATRDKGLVPCFGCGATPLCRIHAAAPCAACEISPGPVGRGRGQQGWHWQGWGVGHWPGAATL